MAYFVIVGRPDCPAFAHVVHVARYLQERLPIFSAHIIQKKTGDWEPWLEEQNWKNEWHHSCSPIIWKELSMRGGIPHYVGGLSEFWEYCYDYYGLESIISPEDLQKLVQDNLQFLKEEETIEEQNKKNIRQIGIIGVYNKIFSLLITELLQISDLLQDSGGLKFNLYDTEAGYEDTIDYINETLEDILHLIPTGKMEMFTVFDTTEAVVKGCDLLIAIGDFSRRKDELEADWMVRNMSSMFILADNINAFAKRSLRLVIAMNGPICYNANVLIESCTTIRIQNIVVVTSDVGLGPLQQVADQVNVPVSRLSAPPVWGYIGVNQFVDVESAVICCDIYRPYQRVLRNKGGSTLPLGEIQKELRYVAYLINNVEEIQNKSITARKIIQDKLNRTPVFSKVRATISLLKLWYSKEPSDDIISLGVCSNGAHGIPAGIVFSQPVILEKNLWVPFKNFPLTTKAKREIEALIPKAVETAQKATIGSLSSSGGSYYSFV